jgi:hypothetical protein
VEHIALFFSNDLRWSLSVNIIDSRAVYRIGLYGTRYVSYTFIRYYAYRDTYSMNMMKNTRIKLKIESSNPTHATWCVTLIKSLYPFVLNINWVLWNIVNKPL